MTLANEYYQYKYNHVLDSMRIIVIAILTSL